MTALLEWTGLLAGVWIVARGLRRLKIGMMIVGAIVCAGFAAALAHDGQIPLDTHVGLFVGAFLAVVWNGLISAPPLPPRPSAPLVVPTAPAATPQPRPDAQDQAAWERPITAPARLLLRYRDAGDIVTDREVKPNSLKGKGAVSPVTVRAIGAYCLMRKGNRTFRLDRIVHAADPETGEVIDLLAWLSERMR